MSIELKTKTKRWLCALVYISLGNLSTEQMLPNDKVMYGGYRRQVVLSGQWRSSQHGERNPNYFSQDIDQSMSGTMGLRRFYASVLCNRQLCTWYFGSCAPR